MRNPTRFNDSPSAEVKRRQARKEAADKERFEFKTGKLFSTAGGNKARKTPPKVGR